MESFSFQGQGGVQKTRFSFWLHFIFLICVVVAAGCMFGLRTHSYPMQNWDEGIHAQVTNEMVSTQEYWTLHYQGEPYFRKPPLKMWLSAPLVFLFGNEVWVHRFWSVAAGVGTVVLLSWFILRREKSVVLAALFAGLFIGGQFIFYHAFRTGETDSLLVFILTGAMVSFLLRHTSPRWLWVTGLFCGLALLTKSFAGFLAPISIFILLLCGRDWKLFKSRDFWMGVGFLFAVAVPWHLSQYMIHGKAFFDEYIGFHVVDRAISQLYAELPVWWYVKMIFARLFPASLFLPAAILIALRDVFTPSRKEFALAALVWFFIPLILFTLVKTKFEWYILPLYPAACWLVARFFHQWYLHKNKIVYWALGLTSMFFVLAHAGKSVPVGAKSYWFTLQAYIPTAVSNSVNPYLLSLGVCFLFLLLYVLLKKYRTFLRSLGIILVAFYLIFFGLIRNAGMVKTLPSNSVYQDIANVARQVNPKEIVIYNSDLYDKPAGYYELIKVAPMRKLTSEIDADIVLSEGRVLLITSQIVHNSLFERIATIENYHMYVHNE